MAWLHVVKGVASLDWIVRYIPRAIEALPVVGNAGEVFRWQGLVADVKNLTAETFFLAINFHQAIYEILCHMVRLVSSLDRRFIDNYRRQNDVSSIAVFEVKNETVGADSFVLVVVVIGIQMAKEIEIAGVDGNLRIAFWNGHCAKRSIFLKPPSFQDI